MSEVTVPASEARRRFADLLEGIEGQRVLVTKHGRGKAYLIGARELHALEETLAVLECDDLMNGIRQSLDDVKAGRVEDAPDAFAELDAEFGET